MTCDSMLLLGSPFVDIYPRCDASSLLTSADIPDPPPARMGNDFYSIYGYCNASRLNTQNVNNACQSSLVPETLLIH
jgi:hypothetical protein